MRTERRFPRGFSVFDPMATTPSLRATTDTPRQDPLESFLAEMMASMVEYTEGGAAHDLPSEQQMSVAA